MHIMNKKKLSELGLDTRVPDETLDRNTKLPLGDEGGARRDELKVAADTAFSEQLKREMKRG
jgi:hypothetical protein